ncbi:MAG TPA: hypothetical protein VGE29_06180 [Prosthecobacter sp.]
MARSRHYSPQLSRLLVSALYHEGKRRRRPMTKLANEILEAALKGTPGWILAGSNGNNQHTTAASLTS